jgi:hypothetical protein
MSYVSVHQLTRARKFAGDSSLVAEHNVLARYLANVGATQYQSEKYVAAHCQRSIAPVNAFDRRLLHLSRSSVIGLAIVDAYTGTFYRVSVVQLKLVLTLAILECSPPSFAVVDAPDPGGRRVLWRIARRVIGAAGLLLVAVAILGPVHMAYAFTERWRR